jgi:hypothetical protein
MEKLTLEEKISWVLGLVIECPLQDPLETCPAKELRGLPVQDSAALISNMEEAQLDEIISHHRQCLWERERELLGRDG